MLFQSQTTTSANIARAPSCSARFGASTARCRSSRSRPTMPRPERSHRFRKEDGTTGPDNDFAARGVANLGAWILGRNMFGPVRGPWPDDTWKGWWGDNPPYHVPVFVLTHHPRASITMAGGTTFHFVTEGIHAALERARGAAKGQDVRLGGGVRRIQQYLRS